MIFEFGKCPECESYNVIYGDITWNEDYVYPRIQQEAHCCDCGCEFREFYNTTPDGTETDEHGKKYEEEDETPPESSDPLADYLIGEIEKSMEDKN